MSRIEPTVGRNVHFYDADGRGPFVALITEVTGPNHVRIRAFDVFDAVAGRIDFSGEVRLLQADHEPERGVARCEWMPYQVGQAAKASDSSLPHVQRMQLELKELVERLQRLSAFLHDEANQNKLDPLQHRLMFEQLNAMKAYAETLAARIALA